MVKYHELDGEIVVYDYIDYALPVGSTGVIEAYNATPLSFRDRVCWARLDPINSHYLKLVESDHRISGRHVEDSLCRECRKLPAYYLRKCFNCTNFSSKTSLIPDIVDLFLFVGIVCPSCRGHLVPIILIELTGIISYH